ncbi:MAG: hypothetical protein ACYS1A_02810 [Planctomycetota bacterium]|jgi:hypothetical protein
MTEKSPSIVARLVETIGNKFPRLTRRQSVVLAVLAIIGVSGYYISRQFTIPDADPLSHTLVWPNEQRAFTVGENAHAIPIYADGNATVELNIQDISAKDILQAIYGELEVLRKQRLEYQKRTNQSVDLTDLLEVISAFAKQGDKILTQETVLRNFKETLEGFDTLIESNRIHPKDTDVRNTCMQSRRASIYLCIAIAYEMKEAEEMAAQLEHRYSAALNLIAPCPCQYCKGITARLRSGHEYLANVREYGESYVTPQTGHFINHIANIRGDPLHR